ncbi:Trm112p-domain-containing protein [Cystobasidium minutum MCA 4210]|uniref:Trm112p-domain-containing protein n=1 Tax=Cystobasidium minutum MCA 4210 TaxID=1397322 RepID=UPI0034CD0817|eukprot:jgi/Rhomi1/158274/estExt_Genewise1Plus.C_2_t20468
MRLLTHNLLACHARSCNAPTNFPLQLKDVSSLEVIEAEQNFDFLTGLIEGSKLDYKALVGAAKQLGDTTLPDEEPAAFTDVEKLDEELLQKLHHVLLELHVQEGAMVCPSCSHVYNIKAGIPNMLLAEHEIRR